MIAPCQNCTEVDFRPIEVLLPWEIIYILFTIRNTLTHCSMKLNIMFKDGNHYNIECRESHDILLKLFFNVWCEVVVFFYYLYFRLLLSCLFFIFVSVLFYSF